MKMRNPWIWFVVAGIAMSVWTSCVVIYDIDLLQHLAAWWPASVTMVFGSFIAGASAEGGGAVAFPVFTLILKIPPDAARNFSLMIQSVGMVSASAMIIGLRIPIEHRAVIIPSIGGIVGMVLGTYTVAPLMEPVPTKLFFVSLWLGFGIGLWRINRSATRHVRESLPARLERRDVLILLTTGFIGGIVTSVVGNGIDMLTFCVLTLWYGLSEKVSTPTSVVLMSVLTVAGTAFHAGVVNDIGPKEFNAWIAAAPVVVFVAPLGAWVASKLRRLHIAYLLQIIIVAQFVGALLVLTPSLPHLAFTAAVSVVSTAVMLRIDRTGQ
ncbi:MAG: sulfite exporter TauE/SafE family protein [Candidatus Kapabacteria bacterium]|nr:sulfite exporter TauE/SafE family protein [Candidatus Kapabacteria bacterium]